MTINQMFGSSPNNEAETVTEVLPDGYKKTELGIIPTEWYVESIGNLVSITTGSKNTQDRIENGAYPFFVRSQTVERINTYSFDGEGVLTAGDGVGTGKIFHYINGKFDFHQRVYLMYNFGEKLDGFFFYKFFSNNFYDRIMSMTAKSSVDSVRREMIADMKMLVPTRHEQTAIANALSDVDALIQELEKLIAKKQAIKTATMQQLLTGRTRLPQFAHHPDGRKKGYKPSELGEIPEDWQVLSLGTASSFSNGRAYALHEWETAGTPVIRLQNLTGRGEDYYYSNMQLPERQYCQEGDLLFMWSATFGPVIWKGPKAIYHYHIWKIICNSGFSQAFMLHLLDDMTEKLKSGSSSGGTMLHVTKHKMETTKAVFPVFQEQAAIGTLLDDMDEEIRALENRLNKTRQIKQGMMQELLTGKTRLVKPAGAA